MCRSAPPGWEVGKDKDGRTTCEKERRGVDGGNGENGDDMIIESRSLDPLEGDLSQPE